MDEFEAALRHSLVDPPCQLLAEIHATLIYILRTVPFDRHSAIVSLVDRKQEQGGDNEVFGVTVDQLTTAMADVGNNWERAPLRHSDGREGWEESLVGCLKDVRIAPYRVHCRSDTRSVACQPRELPSPARDSDPHSIHD